MSERRIGNLQQWFDVANTAVNIVASGGRDDLVTMNWYNACFATAAQYGGKHYNDTGVSVHTGARPGERWADGRSYFAGFTTILAPNGPSCTAQNVDWDRGVFTASSRHPSIVNVLLADGSVRSVGNSIDVVTWQALGTRANNEVLGEY